MKYLYSIITLAIFTIGFAASDESEEYKSSIKKLCGTYVVTDEDNVTYTIKINEDKSMTAEGGGRMYYGSWDIMHEQVRFKFAGDNNEKPRIKFKVGTLWIETVFALSDDGFMYGEADGYGDPSRHDPQYRLK